MSAIEKPSASVPVVQDRTPAPRPRYEPPRVVRKKAVTRATLFTGRGGSGLPPETPPLVGGG
jgi:hypothetical protein